MDRLRTALTLALVAATPAALTACASDEPDVEVVVETPPEEVGEPALLGLWAVTEVDGAMPTSEVTLQFTPTGEMIRTENGEQQRAAYTFAGDAYVEVTDAAGLTRYEVELQGTDGALLRTGSSTLRLARRGGEVDLSTVPAPRSSAAVDTAAGTTPGAPPAPVAPPDTTPSADR